MNILMAELPENSNLQSIELSVCMGCIQVFVFLWFFLTVVAGQVVEKGVVTEMRKALADFS